MTAATPAIRINGMPIPIPIPTPSFVEVETLVTGEESAEESDGDAEAELDMTELVPMRVLVELVGEPALVGGTRDINVLVGISLVVAEPEML